MRIRSFFMTIILMSVFIVNSYGQRIVGYVQGATMPINNIAALEFQYMTDVVYAFIMPTTSGNLILDRVGSNAYDFAMDNFQLIKSKCYPMVPNGPKLWIAVGGASGTKSTRLGAVITGGAAQTTFINELVAFVNTHELEGIDLDWEFPTAGTETTNYGNFINALRAALPAGKKISVAVGGETASCGSHINFFPNNATVVGNVDYFHIMAYDLPAVNHSTLTDANLSMNNWSTCRTIAKSKMLMAVPFYGKTNNSSWTGTALDYSTFPQPAAFGSDVSGSHYYNGGSTSTNSIPNKINAVRATHDANGIVLWAVEQDNIGTNYSLLRAAYNKMYGDNATTNPCAPPVFLGKDTTKCIGQTLTLTPRRASDATTVIGAITDRTFLWYKNGVSLGVTTATYAVPAAVGSAGTYRVVITQRYNGGNYCTVSDEIVVEENAQVTGLASSEPWVCSTGTPTSSNISGTSTATINWYTSATTGASVGSGTPLSVSPTTTTTYYAQTATTANKRYFAGRGAIASNAVWAERTGNFTQTTRPEWVHKLTVYQPLTFVSVVMYHTTQPSTNPSNLSIMIMNASVAPGTTIIHQTSNYTPPGHTNEPVGVYPIRYNVNYTLQPGVYYIGVYSACCTATAPPGVGLENPTSINHPTGVPGVYYMEGKAYQNNGSGYGTPSAYYGQLYDYRFTSAALTQCTRPSVVVTHDCTLPVDLVDFTGSNQGQSNLLSWNTTHETNSSHFVIERASGDGNFVALGSVQAQGNSNNLIDYNFTDYNPVNGANYYRLAQHDLDGTVSYSSVVVIYNDGNASYSVAPNPSQGQFTVTKTSADINSSATVQVVSTQGSILEETVIPEGALSVNVGGSLKPGLYFLYVRNGGSTLTYKVVKQ